jgi:transposase InsO family protein
MSGFYADRSIKAEKVVTILKQLSTRHGVPQRVQTDNGSEFASGVFDKWAYEHRVTLDFSRPGRPTDNPFIESFNGSFRMSARTPIGSCRFKMLGRRSNRGGKSITTFVPIRL